MKKIDKSHTFLQDIRLLIKNYIIHLSSRQFLGYSGKVRDKQKGVAILVVVLVISAVILAIVVSITLGGIDELNMIDHQNRSQETLAIADGCLEEALLSLNRDHNYSGTSLILGRGSCIIVVTNSSGLYTLSVTAVLERYTRRLQGQVKFTPSFTLISRKELID